MEVQELPRDFTSWLNSARPFAVANDRVTRSESWRLVLLWAVLLWVMSACSADQPSPLPPPTEAQSAAIGVRLETKTLFGFRPPVRVIFAKLGDSLDLTNPAKLVPSNFTQSEYSYLLNATPGKYVAVMAVYRMGTVVYLSKEAVLTSVVDVAPGHFSYMGHLEVGYPPLGGDYDEVQSYFLDLTRPKQSVAQQAANAVVMLFGVPQSFIPKPGLLIKHSKSEADEGQFLSATKSSSGGSAWAAQIDNHLTPQ